MLPSCLIDKKTGRALVSTATQCGRFLVVAGEDGTIRTWRIAILLAFAIVPDMARTDTWVIIDRTLARLNTFS
jgi:hypothetical protein